MLKKIAICPQCQTKIICEGEQGQQVKIQCTKCDKKGLVTFEEELSHTFTNFDELDFYPVNEPFAYIRILKDRETLDRFYKVIEPFLNEKEQRVLDFIQNALYPFTNNSILGHSA